MKTKCLTQLCRASALAILAMTTSSPAFAVDGYATVSGNTTGGQGGPTVTVTNLADFVTYVGTNIPYNVQLQGAISSPTNINVKSDKTVVGLGANATINGTLYLSGASNVVVRNLFILNNVDENGNGTDDEDGMSVLDNSHHVWVDHCTFSDCLDGELDITKGADFVTVSWCKFYYTFNGSHNFVNLIGHDDANAAQDTGKLHVTWHHNWWSTLCHERMPRARYGQIHSYNNYFNAPGNNYCIRASISSEVFAVKNVFENVDEPFNYFPPDGKILGVSNAFIFCTNVLDVNDPVFTPPYAYTMDETNLVAAIVTNNAGAGRLTLGTGTNSWTDGSGKWETDINWSLFAAPSLADAADLVTIAANDTITIDATTSGGFPATLTISNLTLSGSVGTTNTLFLNSAGATTPLRMVDGFAINSGGAVSVTDSVLRVDGLSGGVFADDGAVLLNTGTIIATNTSTSIGYAGSGSLTVLGGSMLVRDCIIGNLSGSVGTVTASGGLIRSTASLTAGSSAASTGAIWLNGADLVVTTANTRATIGGLGSGQLTISNGTVSSVLMTVASGAGSAGTVTIAGGTNLCTSGLLIGELAGATGAVWITGGSLSLPGSSVTVGRDGTGQLTLSNGTIVGASFSSVTVGSTSGSAGTLTVAGGTITGLFGLLIGGNPAGSSTATGTVWVVGGQITATGGLTIGNAGVGRMIVSNAVVTFGSPVIGLLTTGRGTLTVAGGTLTVVGVPTGIIVGHASTGAVWLIDGQITVTNAFSTIGNFSSGQMTVSNGVLTMGNFSVGNSTGSRGTLTVAGGTLMARGFITIGSASTGTAWWVGGEVVATNDTTIIGSSSSGQLIVSNAVVTLSNAVVGASSGGRGTLTAAAGTNSVGGITVGNFACTAVGTITVAGGRLFVTNAAHTAVLDVRSGTVALNSGTLVVDKLIMTNSCGFFSHTGGMLIYGSAVLSSNRDDDGDGIPNGYEQSHGLDPLDSVNATMDSDGDGLTDLQEFLAGTDPTNSASTFRVSSVVPEGNNFRVTWSTAAGKTNALQVTSGGGDGSYATNSFTDLFTVTNTLGTTTNYLDVGGATNAPARYYRVRLVP